MLLQIVDICPSMEISDIKIFQLPSKIDSFQENRGRNQVEHILLTYDTVILYVWTLELADDCGVPVTRVEDC